MSDIQLRPLPPSTSTFNIQEIPAESMVNALTSFRNNKKVEIVTQDNRGKYYCYSGDQISLAELRNFMPEGLFNQVILFDRNQDGVLTEAELINTQKSKSGGEEIATWTLGFAMTGALVGGFVKAGALIGAGVGLGVGAAVGAAAGAVVGIGVGAIKYFAYDKKKAQQQSCGYIPETNWNANKVIKTVL